MRKYQNYITGDDGDYDAYTANWIAQTFTPTLIHMVSKVKLKLFRVGSPGTITVSIKATSGGEPVGADLCVGTIEGTGITEDSNGAWYEITLGDGYVFEKDVMYAIVVRAPSGDASNKVSWRADTSSPTYTGGTVCTSSDSGVDWGTVSGADMMFEEWGAGEASPTTTVWGNLFKSQISSEKIEEAIARLIQAHEDDPNAHIESGESLFTHKASEIIDHLAASIIADKIKEWEELKIQGDLMRLDFSWFTIFESIDGFYKTGAGLSLDSDGRGVILTTSGVENNEVRIYKFLGLWSPVLLSWDKNRRMRAKVKFFNNTNQDAYVIMGRVAPDTSRHVGFKVEDGVLYATMADGTTEETINCGNVSTATVYELEVDFIAGTSAEFFVQGVSKGTLSTNIPTGGTDSSFLMWLSVITREAASKKIQVGFFNLWQASE